MISLQLWRSLTNPLEADPRPHTIRSVLSVFLQPTSGSGSRFTLVRSLRGHQLDLNTCYPKHRILGRCLSMALQADLATDRCWWMSCGVACYDFASLFAHKQTKGQPLVFQFHSICRGFSFFFIYPWRWAASVSQNFRLKQLLLHQILVFGLCRQFWSHYIKEALELWRAKKGLKEVWNFNKQSIWMASVSTV